MKNFTLLVCLYKKDIYNSGTLKSIINNDFINQFFQLYIWDNSPERMTSENLQLIINKFPEVIYRHCSTNEVLSKVYNTVIEEMCNNENGYLVLCDDDSELPANYFEQIIDTTSLHAENNLFLPQIVSGNKVISPAKNFIYFTNFIKEIIPGFLSSRYITAINSGKIISNRVFINGFRYDERLHFYGTDNYFMHYYAKHYPSLYILDVKILHDISFNTSSDLLHKIKVFKEAKRSNKIIYEKNRYDSFVIMLNNFIVAIKLCLKYKTFKFLHD